MSLPVKNPNLAEGPFIPSGDALKKGAATGTIEERFRQLEAIWSAETGHLSSATKIINHPAFQEILQLGPAVIPLMLADLKKQPSFWVWALPDLTGANPVPLSDGGNIAKMTEAGMGRLSAWVKR